MVKSLVLFALLMVTVSAEIYGDQKNSLYHMEIAFCQAWNGEHGASAIKDEVKRMYPGKFYFTFVRDVERTGRLLATMGLKGVTASHIVHNKQEGHEEI